MSPATGRCVSCLSLSRSRHSGSCCKCRRSSSSAACSGLFAFFYACLHFLTYIWLDKFFNLHEIFADIAKRKFITVGLTGLLLLIPLAITSTTGWIRRLGGKRWQTLHRLVYFAAIAGVFHYLWLVKADTRKPLQYGAILAVLLLYRVVVWATTAAKKRPRPGAVVARPAVE